jgi:hypothetical protein
MLFGTARGASSSRHMNGYAEDYAVFFFDLVEPDAREKRLAAAWKIYEAGRMQGLLPSTPFQSVSRRLPRKYMRRKKRKEFSQTTVCAILRQK